ncbi:hypothetical protein GGR21_001230 [Dysgonomonas hofstadii]|uniref:DUF4876 domain-containing protein n=1 Tax=Dysgonomonas hofstadii TaxID=637886 RepID=A0A840CJJ4_9BACT|nr:DUF4876 domain-containing protein [Dysgonomonas hofstadii]MBB4035341.1 hypothetical protein [Dysgonomonas hofstadii]
MRNYLKYLFAACCMLLIHSCADNQEAAFKEVNTKILLKLNNFTGDLENPLSIKVTNHSGIGNEVSFTREISHIGDEIQLTNLIPGIYTFTISGKLTPEESQEIFGVNSELLIKANKTSVYVYDYTENESIELNLEASTVSSLVFKEIYYAGTKYEAVVGTKTNYFYEQFYEIYNNSDEVVFLDSLCISNVYPTSGVPAEFDPSLSDYLFGMSVWMIPGTGEDVPLDPGKSIVIALSGRNHKEVDESLLDLSSADYEAYVLKIDGSAPLDYPVPNMLSAFWTQSASVRQWLTSVMGSGMVIYKLPYTFDETDTAKPLNSTAATVYVKIPKSAILDAVDCLRDDTRYNEKRFPASLDAGYATVTETYNGKSISRKILQTTADGRIIFQDTNNSSEDFEVQDTPQLRRHLNN